MNQEFQIRKKRYEDSQQDLQNLLSHQRVLLSELQEVCPHQDYTEFEDIFVGKVRQCKICLKNQFFNEYTKNWI